MSFALIYASLAPALIYLFVTLLEPRMGLLGYLFASYFAIGLNRYIEGPLGLSIDILLGLTWVALFFSTSKEDRKRANNLLTWIMVFWLGYTVLELFNPEARSREAWFFAVRGLSVYFALSVPLAFILIRKRKELFWFMKLYLGLTLLVALWGFKQKFLGLDPFEEAWLEAGASSTHILFGRLRIFSFLSDAGQFGALMAHGVIIATVIGLGARKIGMKVVYLLLAGIFFLGLAYSGSRGPLIIIFAGLGMYLLLIRNFRLLFFGLVLGAGLFVFLKFTSIGSGIYEIQRLRTALNPNDASFMVRLENQRKLRAYLASRPFGGGVGSGGNWGQRFAPGSFLSEVPYDSWYVKVWVETGIIGLLIYIGLLLLTLMYCYSKLRKVTDKEVRLRLVAFYAGYFGLVVGSYGNQIYGQTPISTIIVFTLVFICIGPDLTTEHEPSAENSDHNGELPNRPGHPGTPALPS